jgi:PAS domain S-box-containing protein
MCCGDILMTGEYFKSMPAGRQASRLRVSAKSASVSILITAAAYFIAARLSLYLAFEHTNASPVWPPAGIALAAALLAGYRIAPGIFIGAFFANIFTLKGIGISLSGSIIASSATAFGNTAEAVAGAWLIRRFIGDNRLFDNKRDILIFILCGALLNTIISAAVGATSLCIARGEWNLYGPILLTWWMGDATGSLLVAPLILSWPNLPAFKWRKRKVIEASLMFLALVLIAAVVFAWDYQVKFLLIPVLLWAILRFDLFETSLSIVLLSGIAIFYTLRHANALTGKDLNSTFIFIQSYLGVVSSTALFLSVAVGKQKRTEKDLLSAKRFNDTIIDSIPGAFYVLDTNGKLIRWNNVLGKLNEMPHDAIGGMDSLKNIHEDDKGHVSAKITEAFEKGESETEARIMTKDGPRNFLFTGRRIDTGDFPYVVGTGIDITERKSAQLALDEYHRNLEDMVKERTAQLTGINETLLLEVRKRREIEGILTESEKKYRDLVEGANSVILRWTKDGVITFINRFAQDFFGYKEEEILGKNIMETIVPSMESTGRDLNPLIRELTENPKAYTINENENIKRNGERVWIAWSNTPIPDKDGRITEVLSVGNDITRRKVAEDRLKSILDELEIAKERAEESDRLKSAFLATMSHELRTPLNSIIGFTGIILQGYVGPLNDEQAKQLSMVRNSANHLLSLINDVLDISKIEAGEMKVSMQQFNLPDLIEKAVQSSRPLADKKGLSLLVTVYPDIGLIMSDYRRVEQILLNLLSNAIKFTERGEIKVECREMDGFVRISVADSGIGIKEEDMDKLFMAFQQVDSGITRKYEGTGLGLHICKKITELLNGKIWVTSAWGSGATFYFTLPYKKGVG